jgi:hypothetical protein
LQTSDKKMIIFEFGEKKPFLFVSLDQFYSGLLGPTGDFFSVDICDKQNDNFRIGDKNKRHWV